MNGSSDWPTETITSDAQSLHDTDLPARRGVADAADAAGVRPRVVATRR